MAALISNHFMLQSLVVELMAALTVFIHLAFCAMIGAAREYQ